MPNKKLWYAASNGNIAMVNDILRNNSPTLNINYQSKERGPRRGTTPLYIAAQNGHMNVVQRLLSEGANINQATKDGRTPLLGAVLRGHNNNKIVEFLLSHGANITDTMRDGTRALYLAAKSGNTEAVEMLIAKGADVNHQKNTGHTPLFIAAMKGYIEIVKLLLEAEPINANPNLQDNMLFTPLHIAAFTGHDKIIEELVRKGGDIRAKTHDYGSWAGRATPLALAVAGEQEDTVELLLDNYYLDDTSLKKEALKLAIIEKNEQMVDIFLRRGVKLTPPETQEALNMAPHPSWRFMHPIKSLRDRKRSKKAQEYMSTQLEPDEQDRLKKEGPNARAMPAAEEVAPPEVAPAAAAEVDELLAKKGAKLVDDDTSSSDDDTSSSDDDDEQGGGSRRGRKTRRGKTRRGKTRRGKTRRGKTRRRKPRKRKPRKIITRKIITRKIITRSLRKRKTTQKKRHKK